MYDLMDELQQKTRLLDEAVRQYGKRGQAYAKAEHDYRVALAKRTLEKRNEGVPVTIISDICRGAPDIAQLRLEKDIAETVYESAKEAIQSYKLQIRILDAQIEREWGGAK